MNEETHNSTIEPELEARIVALVLGEASDFETEELKRLIALRPELVLILLGTNNPSVPQAVEDLKYIVGRLRDESISEVILALNATVDGQTTAHYIAETLEPAGLRITSLAQGVPVGGELDYLDDGTIGAALAARRAI